MAPATEASKYRSRWAFSAAANSVAPSSASSALLAVTTDAPCSRAARISERAGSIPPMTSIDQVDVVAADQRVGVGGEQVGVDRRPAGPARPAARLCRAAPAARPRARPARSPCSTSSRATCVPTTPQPSRATPSGRASPCWLIGSPRSSGTGPRSGRAVTTDLVHPGAGSASGSGTGSGATSSAYMSSSVSRRTTTRAAPVADRDDRRPRHVVVVAGQGAAVRTGAGHGEQVAGGDVARQELVLDHDVAGLAVPADDAGEHGGGGRRAGRPECTSSRRRTARGGCCRSCRRRPTRRAGSCRDPSATGLTVPTS